MNGLDIAFFIVLFFFFLRGIFRGFVKEAAGIFGLFIGFFAASNYYPVIADQAKNFMHNESYREVLAFLVIFIVVFFLIGLLGLLLDKLVKLTVSVVANGLLGAAIGILKGAALACVVLMVVTAFIREDTPFFRDSITWPYLRYATNTIKEIVPADLKQSLEANLPEKLQPMVPDLPQGESLDPPPWKPALPGSKEPAAPAWPDSNKQ